MFEKMEEYRNSEELQAQYFTVGHYVNEVSKSQSKKFRKERRRAETETQEENVFFN